MTSDNVVMVSNDFMDGRTISSMAVGEAAGAHDKNISTVEGDGTFGALYGAMRVWAGFKSTLVVVHAKGSEGDPRFITNGMFDPIFQRTSGFGGGKALPPCRPMPIWKDTACMRNSSPWCQSKTTAMPLKTPWPIYRWN